MAKEILCGFGIDVDAVAGWLGSYGGEDSPDDISRGLFAGEVGSPRLLKLFARLGIKTTWFIPGHSIETFPAEMNAVAEAGHEIGIHGYSHENPIAMTCEQEMAVLDKCIDLVTQLSGRRPTGYVAPWWEFSTVTNELLLERGIKRVHLANRTIERARGLADQFGANVLPVAWVALGDILPRTGILVNTTSLGMKGQPPLELDVGQLPSHAVVAGLQRRYPAHPSSPRSH